LVQHIPKDLVPGHRQLDLLIAELHVGNLLPEVITPGHTGDDPLLYSLPLTSRRERENFWGDDPLLYSLPLSSRRERENFLG
jgi:hypothetical protein